MKRATTYLATFFRYLYLGARSLHGLWFKQLSPRMRQAILLVLVSNGITHAWVFHRHQLADASPSHLYLMEEALPYLEDPEQFGRKVHDVSAALEVPPEWLMAVMYAESKFDTRALNHKGSGAVGLIQFMPFTAKELGVEPDSLVRMPAHQQMDYVHRYLAMVRRRHGDFRSLTDLYLAILYPKAIGQDACYTLFGSPSKRYRQNAGLDENQDGFITVSDIDRRLLRIFPTAYDLPTPAVS